MLTFFTFMVFTPMLARAQVSSGVTYQGRILTPDKRALEDASVSFRLQIRSPDTNNCLLFEEQQTLDMRNSGGAFSLTMNDGSGVRLDSTGIGFDRVFANRGSFAVGAANCASGSTYSPNENDGRRLVVLFKSETMSTWEPTPALGINYVPFAFDSQMVTGFKADSLLRVVNANGDPLGGVSPLSNAQYNELKSLIAGTSTLYSKTNQLGGSALPTLTSGQVLGWNGTSWVASDPLPANSVATDRIQDSAVTSAKIADGSIAGSDLAANISINTTSTIQTSGTVSSNVTTARDFRIYDSDAAPNENYVSIRTLPSLTANFVYTWPGSYGSASQVLTTDGSGVLTWATPPISSQWVDGAGSSISYGAGNVGLRTSAPTASLHIGAGATGAGRAPLKLTSSGSGVLLATPEDGAMEYDGTGLWFTIGTTRYLIPTTTAAGNYSNVNNISNVGGSITMTPAAGNSVIVNQSTVSTSSSTGALIVNGGVGIAGSLNTAGNINALGSISTSGSVTSTGSAVQRTETSTANAQTTTSSILTTFDPATDSATYPQSLDVRLSTAATAVNYSSSQLSAGQYQLNHYGTGTLAGGAALTARGSNRSTGTLTGATGVSSIVRNFSSGTISNAYAYFGSIANTGGGTLTNGYGLYLKDPGAIANYYGVYIENPATATNAFPIYVAGGPSYFGGKVGIGVTAPLDSLHVENNQNGQTQARVVNSDTGSNAQASFAAMTTSSQVQLLAFGSGRSAYTWIRPSGAALATSSGSTGGLALAARNSASGNITFHSGGDTERMRLDTSGNLGIGTTSPGALLDVAGAITARGVVNSGSATSSQNGSFNVFTNGGSLAGYLAGSSSGLSIGSTLANQPLTFSTSNGTSSERMRILGDGKVGIGTTTPGSALEVNGNIVAGSSTYTRVQVTGGGGSAALAEYYAGYTNPYWSMGRDAMGSGKPGLVFNSSGSSTAAVAGSAVGQLSANTMSLFVSDGTSLLERARFDSSGNFGIGTTTPAAKLDVAGSANFNSFATTSGLVSQAGTAQYPSLGVQAITDTGNSQINLQRAQGTSVATAAAVNDLDYAGALNFRAYNGTQYENAAGLIGVVDGTNVTGSGSHPGGRLDFVVRGTSYTNQYGFPTPAMTIRNSGRVGVGTTAPATILHVVDTGSAGGGIQIENTTNGSVASPALLFKTTAGQQSSIAQVSAGSVDSGVAPPNAFLLRAPLPAGIHIAAVDTTGKIRFFTGGSASTNERARIDSAGNFGIGVTNPSQRLQVAGNIVPGTDATNDLGTSSLKFVNVYATSGVVNTSDLRMKRDVRDSDLGLDFVRSLRPVSYYWRTGSDDRLHYGLIAQEARDAISRAKKPLGRSDETDNVIVTHDKKTDAYGLRYTELISPLIKAVQELFDRIMKSEARLEATERALQKFDAKKANQDEVDSLRKENAMMKAWICSKDRSPDFCRQ